MAKRKIGFYYLFLKQRDFEFPIENYLSTLLNFLINKSRIERKQDITSDKIAFIDRCTFDTNEHLLKILFKSAKHSYRAPLLDRNTVEERDNPKTIDEGEQIKTHVLIKFSEGDALTFIETGGNMLTYNNIADYLNRILQMYNAQSHDENERIPGSFCFDMMLRDDFREVLQSMNRVSCASIYADKRILGSEALNFSEPSEELKEDIIIEIKAERKKNIIQHIYDVFDKYNSTRSQIRRIRVKGKLSNENEGIIDTSRMIKKEYIDAQQDEETGEYNTAYIFSQLMLLSRDF